MNNKQSVIDRIQILKFESGLSDKAFKSLLTEITSKTSRTVRRWFSLDSSIQDNDLDLIADHFGKHAHWLRYGERREIGNYIDQIMSSKYFGAVILKDNKVEEVNHKFIEMMKLRPEVLEQFDACEYILQHQSAETASLCQTSNARVLSDGSHMTNLEIVLSDDKTHLIESAALKLDNDRILRILIDKGPLETNNAACPPKDANSLNILYVDDDTMLAKLFETILQNNNCTVNTFNNSPEALAEFKLHNQQYDLLISDIIMPEMTGDELASQCLSIKPGLPVILYTGYAQLQDKRNAEELGVSYYLEKPIDSSELLRLLDKIREH